MSVIRAERSDAPSKDLYHDVAKEIGAEHIDGSFSEFHSTSNDVRDMKRMGKQQQLTRTFRRISSISFVCILTATWEFLFIANTNALTDGGRAGLFWTYIWTAVGMAFVMASLAEMSSMAPTSGGQYHWVSELSPPNYQRVLSYAAGWLATISWQFSSASSGPLIGGIVQGIITLYNPDYPAPAWHLFLMAVANFIFINVFNVYGARYLATMQNGLMALHVFALVTVLTLLWTLAPHPSAYDTLLKFENTGGWPTMGLALCVGQVTTLYVLQGGDCAAHISEEITDAGINVPRSMFWGFTTNAILGFIFCITYIFAIPDTSAALNDPTGFPFLYVFQECGLPKGGIATLTTVLLAIVMASNISANASTARQTFAFARDNGLPFSHWIGRVDRRLKIPANAVWTTMTISILLNLLILGSTAAFDALLSLTVVGLASTYCLSTSVMLWRRLNIPEPLPHRYWSLGRHGPLINAVSIAYLLFSTFFAFWPMTNGWNITTFNWAPVVFIGVIFISMIFFVVQGRKVYQGPVVTVEGSLAGRRLEGFREEVGGLQVNSKTA